MFLVHHHLRNNNDKVPTLRPKLSEMQTICFHDHNDILTLDYFPELLFE